MAKDGTNLGSHVKMQQTNWKKNNHKKSIL